jgi:DNA-binding LacI/PurR family transcriptional regulator
MASLSENRTEPTIRDVAAHAGVSHQTVSRVINGHESVKEATRQRVLASIRALEYVPSPMARGLIRNRTHSVGMVTADISDNFFAQAVAGAELEARRRGYFLIVASVEEEARDDGRAYLRLMLERRVEGLILARPSSPVTSEQVLPTLRAGVPFVAIGSRVPGHAVVDVDNVRGALDATTLLVDRGHREIATITGPLDWPSAQGRLAGYQAALRAAGLPEDPARVAQGRDWGLEAGQEAAAGLLARGTPFTAVFAHSDLSALGAIRAFRAQGLRVPEDVSVVGYDDIPVAAFFDPPLTTVRQPMREVGVLAARLVLDAVAADDGTDGRAREILLPAELVERGTVAPPRRS